MKLAELLQKFVGETTSPDHERDELNKLGSPSFAPLRVPKEVFSDLFKEDSSTTLNAQELLDNEGIKVHYITDPDQASEALKDLIKTDVTLGLDIETAKLSPYEQHEKAGLDPHLSHIRLVQVCVGKTVYIFDVEAVSLNLLEPLWDCPMVAHNAVFEMKHLINAGINPQYIDCTMLMANALNGSLPKLGNLSKDYLDWEISKEQQTSNWNAPSLSEAQLAYAALDAVIVFRLFEILKPQLKEKERFSVYTLMRDAQKAVAKLELNGCYFDLKGQSKLIKVWRDVKENCIQELQKVLGPEVNPDSPVQLSQWLMNNIDDNILRNWPRTEKGQLKTGSDVLANFPDHPLIRPLIKYKEINKLLSSFGTKFATHVNPRTGRIHGSFRLGGTATGRLSCRSPNIQNLPRDKNFRALFSAPPGRVLVVADYNQIELRIAALVSEDLAMLEAYLQGQDLHRKTAAEVTGVPFDKVTKEQRQAAKAINFGLLFGQGPKGLARYAKSIYDVDMTEREALYAKRSFFRVYHGLSRWQRKTGRLSKIEKRVTTPGGRVRDFTKEKNGYKYTQALNTPIQGGAAEVMLAALPKLENYLTGTDAKLVNIIHDEIVVEAAEDDLAQVIIAVDKAMVEGMLKIFPNAITKNLVEIKVGDNWAEAK